MIKKLIKLMNRGDQWIARQIFKFLSERRLKAAKKRMWYLHNLYDGKRFFVLDDFDRPGHYLTVTMEQIKKLQKQGKFNSNARPHDFHSYSKAHTPARNISTAEGPPKERSLFPVYLTIFIMVIVATILLYYMLR